MSAQPPPSTQNTLTGHPNAAYATHVLFDERLRASAPRTTKDAGRQLIALPPTAVMRFDELIPCWNLHVAAGTAYDVRLRVGRSKEDRWSGWFSFGPSRFNGDAPTFDDLAIQRTDYLVCREPCDRVDVQMICADPEARLVRFVLSLANTTGEKSLDRSRREKPRRPDRAAYTRRLPVPFFSQHVDIDDMKGNICSPTSMAMVLAFHGVKGKSPVDVARAAFDPINKIYGNWPLNIQAAFSFGLPAEVRRFNRWDAVENCIAAGQPVIASIRDPDGRLEGTPYKSTTGHLLVVCGFDENGDVLVNDPAGRTAEKGQLAYKRAQFETAWFGSGGVGYLVTPREIKH